MEGNDSPRVEVDLPAGVADVRDPLPPEIRDPSFSSSVRGYDRHAVDAYVERVNRLIAELQVSGSPRAAVRHALDRVGEQTSSILQRARETAEEITSSAREEAEETTARAKAEAEEILAGTEAQAREIVDRAQRQADDAVARAQRQAEEAVAGARTEAEGRIRGAEEAAARLEAQGRERLHALEADMAAVAEQRSQLLGQVREIAARLAELVGEDEPEPEPAAVAPESNGAAQPAE